MGNDWNTRSFSETGNGSNFQQEESAFGNPLLDDAPIRTRTTYGAVAPLALDAASPYANGSAPPAANAYISPREGRGTGPNNGDNCFEAPQLRPPNSDIEQQNRAQRWSPARDQLPGTEQPVGTTYGASSLFSRGVDPKEKIIVDRSLTEKMDMTNYFIESVSGAVLGSGPVPWSLDRLTSRSNGSFANHWKRFASPMNREIAIESASLEKASEVRSDVVKEKALVRRKVLAAAKPLREEMHANYETLEKIHRKTLADIADARDSERRVLLQQKNKTLESALKSMGQVSQAELDSARLPGNLKVPRDGKYLTAKEYELLSKHRQLYDGRSGLIREYGSAESALAKADVDVAAINSRIDNIRNGGSKFDFFGTNRGPWNNAESDNCNWVKKASSEWRGDRWCNKIGEGVAIGGAALAADYFADKLLGHDQQTFSRPSWWLEYPAVTAAVLWPGSNGLTKTALTAGSVVVAKLMDDRLPLPDANYSAAMQPSWIDSVGMSMAWMIPWTSTKARLSALVGAYTLGRLANLAHSWMHVPIPGIGDANYAKNLNADLAESLKKDNHRLSNDSFNGIVEAGAKLAMENDGALKLQFEQFVCDHQNDANRAYLSHGTAALATAVGDVILDRGTKIDSIDSMSEGRLLAGGGYDLGGGALKYYRLAAANLIDLQNHASTVGLNKQQVDELIESRKSIESRMHKIYGRHDLERLFGELQTQFRQNENDLGRFAVNLASQVKAIPASTVRNDPQYVAKLCRDVALVDLAAAEYKSSTHSNGEDASLLWKDAMRFLTKGARQWDPDAQDLPQLLNIAERVRVKVQNVGADQYTNQFQLRNPYGISAEPTQ